MPSPVSTAAANAVDETVLLWLLTNVFGSTMCWGSIYLWSPFSYDDEAVLAPILIILLMSVESLLVLLPGNLLFEKVLAISRISHRVFAAVLLCIGLCIATCFGLLLFKNVIHWIALSLSASAYCTALLLAFGIVYRKWLFFSDAATIAPDSIG